MIRALPRPALPVAGILLLTAIAAFSSHGFGDYLPAVADDNPRPVIEALQGGHLDAARHVFPAMGLVSVLLRVPFSALAGGDHWLAYRFGTFGCLLALAALAFVLDRRAAAAGAAPASRRLLAVALILGPGTLYAMRWGHPEQVLMGALCVGAVLVAQAGRSVWAGVLLGLAIGTKQDAVVATVPVLLAVGGAGGGLRELLTRERVWTAAIATGVAVLCIGPVYLADPAHYRAMAHSLARAHAVYAASLWWPFHETHLRSISIGSGAPVVISNPSLPLGLTRGLVTALSIPIAVALLLVPAVRARRVEPLAVLAFVLAARTAVDPMNITYYIGPALIALIAWESTRAPAAMPVIGIAMTLATGFHWYVALHWPAPLEFAVWVATMAPFFLLGFVPSRGLSAPARWRDRRPAPAARPGGLGTPLH